MDLSLIQEIDEDLQRQRLEAAWKRWGTMVVGGAVALILGTAAVTGWMSWTERRDQTNSAELHALLEPSANGVSSPQASPQALEVFAAQHPSRQQSALARLHAAALLANAGQTQEAAALYDTLAKDTNTDSVLREFAAFQAARTLLDTGDTANLNDRLAALASSPTWGLLARELSGYVALREGDLSKAKAIFRVLALEPDAPAPLVARVKDLSRSLDLGD